MTPSPEHEILDQLEDLFFHAPVALHIVGADGEIQLANHAELRFLGYDHDPSAYIGHHIAEFHADREVIDDMLERLLSDRPLANHAARLVRSDGEIRPVLIDSNSRTEGGRFVNTRCFTRPAVESPADAAGPPPSAGGDAPFLPGEEDDSDRLRRLEDFFDHARVGVIQLDGEGRVLRTNQAARDLLGQPDGDPLVGPMAGPEGSPAWLDALRRGETVSGRTVRWSADGGGERPVRMYANTRFEDGRPSTVRCFLYPVEEAMGESASRFSWPSYDA